MMKNTLIIILDVFFIVAGLVVAAVALVRWGNTGFGIESMLENPLVNGRMHFVTLFLGLGVSSYAFFDILVFRRKINRQKL
jgi:hypothetical protein